MRLVARVMLGWKRILAWSAGLAFATLGAYSPAEASAWNEREGDGLVVADFTFDGGSRYFNGLGKLAPARSYRKEEATGYLEYGVTDWLMAIVKPSVQSVAIGAPNAGHFTGLGTSEAGAQLHVLAFGPAVLAVQGSFRLPPTVSQRNPALVGNTSRDLDGRALLGVGFLLGSWPSFVDVQAGYRIRFEGAPAEWHVDASTGTRPFSRLLLLLQSFTTVPDGAGTPWFPRSMYSKLEASGVYDLTPSWSVQLGLFSTMGGIDALRERGVKAAVWYRF